MPVLFGIDIAQIIADEIGPGVIDATLIVVTPGTRTDSTGGTNPTTQSIDGRGFLDSYSEATFKSTLVQRGDRKITLIANTFPGLPVPKPGDQITIEGDTYTIVGPVKRDPAAATYECQSRL